MSAIQEAVCIQLAKFNDIENSISNARWSNHNKEPVTINQGDNISITKAFVDTRNLSSSGITILDDLPVELEMYFYIINNGNPGSQAQGFNSNDPGKVTWIGPNQCKITTINEGVCYDPPVFTRQYTLQSAPNIIFQSDIAILNTAPLVQTINSVQANVYADGRPYLLCYSDNSRYTQTFKYTIPKGTYSPDEIGTLLTTAMSEVKKTTAFALNNNEASQWWKINPTTQFLDQPFVVNTRGYPPLSCDSFFSGNDGFTPATITQPNLKVVPNNGIQSPSTKSLCFKPIITDCPIPASSLGPIPNGPTINASQCHIGFTYEIITLGDTNWHAMGFDPDVVPAPGGGFLCTAREVLPPPPSPDIIPYTEMQIGKNYIIINPGVLFNYYVREGIVTSYTTIRDTPWSEMGSSDNSTYINNVTGIDYVIINGPINGSDLEINFITGFKYVITEIVDINIDLSLIGGPPNIYGPSIPLYNNVFTGTYYYLTSFGTQLHAPFTQGYDMIVGGIQYLFDNTFGSTRTTAVIVGPIVYIEIPLTTSALYIQTGVTYVILTYDPNYSEVWQTLGAFQDPGQPWVAVRDGDAQDEMGTGYAGFVVPTGALQTITNPTVPTAPFISTYTGTDSVTEIGVKGYIIGTGTVREANFVDGTVQEILNVNSPNYYMYPLKLNGNPGIATQNQGTLVVETKLLYDYGFPLVGATEIELAFNDQLGKFQWSYIHSPIQQGVAPTTGNQTTFQEVVGIVNSFQPTGGTSFISSTCKLTAQSGIMFKRMEPASFWMDVLGFSPNLMVTDDELGLTTDGTLKPIIPGVTDKRFTYSRFDSITSRGLLTTAMNFNGDATYQNAETSYIPGMFYGSSLLPGQPTPPVSLMYSPVVDKWAGYEVAYATLGNTQPLISQGLPTQVPDYDAPYSWNQVWFSALDVTHAVLAERTPLLISDKFGHFLVEIQGYDSTLLNEKQKYGIKAIVSSYYNNIGSFTTLPFNDSAFLYQHVGEPITLNNFRVRILDGNMNEVEGLGRNSSIYIQINKNITPVEVAQVD